MIELRVGDARDLTHDDPTIYRTLIVDPPHDADDLYWWALQRPEPTKLVFTDPGRAGALIFEWGPPAWIFSWDTGSPWHLSPRRPLTQSKLCLWYGERDDYESRYLLPRKNPQSSTIAGTGRRLADIYHQSLRWLHTPGYPKSAGDRWKRADELRKHEKPLDWVAALIANTADGGPVLDPFAGSGTSLLACKVIDRQAVGYEIDPDVAAFAQYRLDELDIYDRVADQQALDI